MNEPMESLNSKEVSRPLELNEVLLADISRTFTIYDRSATNAQKRFIFLRLLILRLSVIVTLLAVLQSEFKNYHDDFDLTSAFRQYFPYFPNIRQFVGDFLGILVILAPISVSILLAGTIKFGRGVNWILLRASAETIKQEMYRYRTQVGNYSDPKLRDLNFAHEIQAINERLMKTQVNQAGLAWNEPSVNKRQSWLNQKKQNKRIRNFLAYRLILLMSHGKQNKQSKRIRNLQACRLIFLMLNGEQNKQSKKGKNALYSSLTAKEYIDERLMNQLKWYRRKTLDLDKKWQLWQWWIYLLGGVGTFLAAMKLDVWIAVSNAIAASILSFLEFRRLDSTLIGYNQTATNLENILWWWYALTDKDRTEPKNIEKLVESSERVIRSETTGWVQEMKDAMADLYKMDEDRLAKEAEEAKKAKEAEDTRKAKETEEAKKAQEAEDARKAQEADKNGDEKTDGETKSVNLDEIPKQEGSEPNLSSIDN